MDITVLSTEFSVCTLPNLNAPDIDGVFFIFKENNTVSLICETLKCPSKSNIISSNWSCFYTKRAIDSNAIAEQVKLNDAIVEKQSPVMRMSTFSGDYYFVKHEHLDSILKALCAHD